MPPRLRTSHGQHAAGVARDGGRFTGRGRERFSASMPGHAEYESVKKMRGFAYYVVEKNGAPALVPKILCTKKCDETISAACRLPRPCILVDIGGTKTRVAASRDLESFGEPKIIPYGANVPRRRSKHHRCGQRMPRRGERPDDIGRCFGGHCTRRPLDTYGRQHSELARHDRSRKRWKRRSAARSTSRTTRRTSDWARRYTAPAGEPMTIVYITVSTGVGGVRIVERPHRLDPKRAPR